MASVVFEAPCWDYLEQRLLEWANTPEALRDEDFEPPTPEVIREALGFVGLLRSNPHLRFSRMSPDGNGGLSFEQVSGPNTLVVDFTPDGAELTQFENGNLTHRRSL